MRSQWTVSCREGHDPFPLYKRCPCRNEGNGLWGMSQSIRILALGRLVCLSTWEMMEAGTRPGRKRKMADGRQTLEAELELGERFSVHGGGERQWRMTPRFLTWAAKWMNGRVTYKQNRADGREMTGISPAHRDDSTTWNHCHQIDSPLGVPWRSSGYSFTFQYRGCRFSFWSGS